MNVLPLQWQGTSRAEALRALVEARVDEWVLQWFSTSKAPAVGVEAVAGYRPEEVGVDARWYALRDGDAALSLRMASDALDQLGCRIANIMAADDSGLAAGVGKRGLTSLARSLFGTQAPMMLNAVDGMPPSAEIGARFGALGVQVSIEGIRIELYFNVPLCVLLVPAAQVARDALVARRDAIGTVDATLDAVLDLGQAVLAETLSLKPGEVLKTSIPISAGLRLVSARGEDIIAGTLVADGSNRALKVTQLHFKKGTP
jgi:hypothetical protein